MTITLKISDNTKEKMVQYFKDKKRPNTPDYAVFQADEEDTIITLYQSGKAVFQGTSADIDASMWKEMEQHLNPNKKIEEKKVEPKDAKDKKNKENKSDVYYAATIGSDEVGTGDYFGPIVVSSAFVSKENIPFLESLGVRDSKKLTDEKIKMIVPQIIKRIPYCSLIVNNKEYNHNYSDKTNMNKMKAILHNKVLVELVKKEPIYDYIVVDQFAQPPVYFRYLSYTPTVIKNITFLTKAEDQCLSVACASLISRYIFIQKFDELGKTLGLILPKGAGASVDEVAVSIVQKYGFDKLEELAKLNFKNTLKVKKALEL